MIAIDPRTEDRLITESALATRPAVGCVKRVARRYGSSRDTIERYLAGHQSSPVYRHDRLIMAADDPWPLVVHAKVVAMRAKDLRDKTEAELVGEFFMVLDLATAAEGRQNCQRTKLFRDGDLRALAELSEAEAGLDEYLAALCLELADRRIDPRDPQWSNPHGGRA